MVENYKVITICGSIRFKVGILCCLIGKLRGCAYDRFNKRCRNTV